MYLLICILVTPILARAQGGPTGVTLLSVPSGTTNETNPEIFVVASGKPSYRFSLNGAPYSPELPIQAPITLSGEVELGGLRFTAGTSELIEFLKLKTTDAAFTDFVDRLTFDELHSPLQVTYMLNKKRAVVAPENVLNLRGAGVSTLEVTLQEKTAIVPGFELRALSISGGHLLGPSSAGGARHFTLLLPSTTAQVTLTPRVDNGETQIFVNGQPSPNGQAITVPVVQEGQSILLQTVGPGNNAVSYVIEVQYDDSLEPTDYRSDYLRTSTPASAYVSIRNTGPFVIDYQLAFNQKFGLTTQEVVRAIQEMQPEFPGEPIQRKVWRFVRDNRYHFDPLTASRWNHSPGLFFSSIGFGYCDDSASLFRYLMTAMGFTSRVWMLTGHVVPEVLVDGRWEMWDPDLQVSYINHSGFAASVEELATNPDLITHPLVSFPGANWAAYTQITADLYLEPSRQQRAGLVRLGTGCRRLVHDLSDSARRHVRVPGPVRRPRDIDLWDERAVVRKRATHRAGGLLGHIGPSSRHPVDRMVEQPDTARDHERRRRELGHAADCRLMGGRCRASLHGRDATIRRLQHAGTGHADHERAGNHLLYDRRQHAF